jgi:hypothetical protein
MHHLLIFIRAPVSGPLVTPRRALPVATLAASRCGQERLLGRALVSPYRQPLWSPWWNGGPATPARSTHPWTESTTFSHWKIIPKPKKSCHFTKKPLYFFDINPRSTYLQEAPQIFENNSIYSPSHFQKLQIGPYNFFSPYLCNRNSKSNDSCAKILRITSCFILCIHLIYVHCIY